MALAHFKTIADATDLPLIVFQYPLATGQGYPAATLERLFDEVPTIRAIKDWTPQVPQHESQIRKLQGRARPINVLTTNSAWLLSSLVLGCNGLLSGSGSVIADLQARLYRAVRANDLAEARRLNDRIYPTARVFYADPFIDMHNRMKEALVLLGKLPRAVVRPPLVKISDAEIARIRDALVEAGLLGANGAGKKRGVASCNLSLLPRALARGGEGSGVGGSAHTAAAVPGRPPTPDPSPPLRGGGEKEAAGHPICAWGCFRFFVDPSGRR